MRGRILGATLALALVGFAAPSCSSPESLGRGFDRDEAARGFTPPDAGGSADADASVQAPVAMCAVTTCSLPWATCASSEFPCDANLLTDDDNCGGCGIRCIGEQPLINSKWSCVGGQCVFSCIVSMGGFRDCDKNPSNGCEVGTTGGNRDHCGDCGVACGPGLDCIKGSCVDECASVGLPDTCDGDCTDRKTDDFNCGTCGTVCDPTGPGLPVLPGDMYYGCGSGRCGQAKCASSQKADCNKVLSDGCEAPIHSNAHCGACNDACPAGKTCGNADGAFRCLCDGDEIYCGARGCRNLNDDTTSCGGCNYACPGVGLPHFVSSCSLGVCGGKCEDGHADCDGDRDNGCEVDTRVDNRNCGGCGNACAPNQVCSEGKCLVAPCSTGKPTTK